MWPLIIKSILILLPAGMSNATPPFATHLFPQFTFPLDFYREISGKRIFGDHKTFRGLISGIIVGTIIFLLVQKFLLFTVKEPSIEFTKEYLNFPWFFGSVLGLGALAGDAFKSFFKRRMNFAPGTSWIPFDQLDWVVGTLITAAIFTKVTFGLIVITLILGFLSHLLGKIIGYILKVNKEFI